MCKSQLIPQLGKVKDISKFIRRRELIMDANSLSSPGKQFLSDLVKRKLTEELATSVHHIQQQYASDQTPIISDGPGEQLAKVFEAILLHGLRPNTWALKFSLAFGISKTSVAEGTNFWNLVSSFSHRDVMQRITESPIVRGDVGRCRLWVRLAFNDGILESYLVAITTASDAIESYYQPGAFLRDTEFLDLTYGLLLGIRSFAFRLPLHKDELNKWDRQTLILAGLTADSDSRLSFSAPPEMTPLTKSTIILPAPTIQAEDSIFDGASDNLTVIPTRPRGGSNNRRARSVSTPVVRPSAVSLPLSNAVSVLAEGNENRDDELEAILRVAGSVSPPDVSPDTDEPDAIPSTIPIPSTSHPLPILRDTLIPPSRDDDNENDSLSSGHSGNLLGKHVGWSSSYDEADNAPSRPTRCSRGNTHESYDALVERGVGVSSYGISTSLLGIGSTQFAKMVDDIQSASSSNGTPTFSGASDLDHDFEVLNSENFVTSKSVEGKKRELLIRIPIEKGMRAQHYKCGACGRPIGMLYGKSRLCNFDKLYYCLDCHLDEEVIIPSRVIHNWDFRKHKTCTRAKELIEAVESTPLFDLKELNPKIYDHIKEVEEVQKQRIQLQILKSYLWTCKKDICEQFNQRLWPQDHLHESVHIYSLSDLVLVHAGTLLPKIKTAVQFGIDHVRKCFLCSQRGFICEVCRSGQVLHAFDTKENFQCPKCYAVFHKKCMNAQKPCPKCQRKFQQARRNTERRVSDDPK
ncbi:Pleckstrin-like proteiny domain-containing family M member 3 [Hypsibius exemplaris]|uniref:Pleckstrin-like proteiny domain-containing family M member 3 n=1 Tax=Hypsibius exemplaris TaxID=2072580 RepID=A0A1W0WUD6_HYPEX|nr:Pleckstrin-like proteiny domain-containing family M member 3 [Hypsibius exemplaris]